MQYLLAAMIILTSLPADSADEPAPSMAKFERYYVDDLLPITIEFELTEWEQDPYIDMKLVNTTENKLCFFEPYFQSWWSEEIQYFDILRSDNSAINWMENPDEVKPPFQAFSIIGPGDTLHGSEWLRGKHDLPNEDLTISIYVYGADCSALVDDNVVPSHAEIVDMLDKAGGRLDKVPFRYPGALYHGQAAVKAEEHYIADRAGD